MTSKDKNLFGAIIISIACFLLFYFLLPSYDTMKQFNTALKDRRILYDARSKAIDNILKLKKDYEANKESIDKIAAIIPAQKHVPELVSAFETIARSTGLALTTINVADNSQTETDKKIKTITITGKLIGTYDAYRNFLTSMEVNQRLIDLEIAKVNQDPNTGYLLIELTSRAYVLANNNR